MDTQSRNEDLWLLHGGIKVAKLSFDNTGQISSVIQIVEADHIPPGISLSMDLMLDSFRRWWSKRSFPASRGRLKETLIQLGVPIPEYLMMRSFGLSLSDFYWLS